jgi:hypothetical protein
MTVCAVTQPRPVLQRAYESRPDVESGCLDALRRACPYSAPGLTPRARPKKTSVPARRGPPRDGLAPSRKEAQMNNESKIRGAARRLRCRRSRQHAPVAPDAGLPEAFLRAAAARLNEQRIRASVEFPGCLVFEAAGRLWATGYTGLHVNDDEGYGDTFPGDERLVALERRGQITLDLYVSELVRMIAAAGSDQTVARREQTETKPSRAPRASTCRIWCCA